jgi:hypothetical protein
MNVLSAYNAGSDRVLSPSIRVVDAARESTKVLWILSEGLAAHARNGFWLVNFERVPITRAASDFDLIYLDEEHRVLQAVEVSQDREFEPFKGHAASALILQPKTIARSRTFTGDRIMLDTAEHRAIDAEPEAPSKRTAHLPSRIVPAFSANSFNVPSESGQDARSTGATGSGRLMRNGSLARDGSSIVRPANPPVAAQRTEISQDAPEGKVVRIAGPSTPLPDDERFKTSKAPPELTPSAPVAAPTAPDLSVGASRTIAPIPWDLAPRIPESTAPAAEIQFESKRTIAPIPREVTASVPPPVLAEAPSKFEQPLILYSSPATKVPPLEPTQPLVPKRTWAEGQPQALAQTDTPGVKSVDQRLESSSSGPDLEAGAEPASLSKKVLSWLLDPDGETRPRKRRAPRINAPRLVAYYFGGGPSTPHEIRNISAVGFYMVTDQRWMLGTVIRVTIQPLESGGDDGITVFARVVRWGPDGGGFEFVFPGRKD